MEGLGGGLGALGGLGNIVSKIQANEEKLKEIQRKREQVNLENSAQKLLEQERKNALERAKKKEQLEKAKALELKQRQEAKKLRRKELGIRSPKVELSVTDSSAVCCLNLLQMLASKDGNGKLLLCCGSDSGVLFVWDVVSNFKLISAIKVRDYYSVSNIVKIDCTSQCTTKIQKRSTDDSKSTEQESLVHTEADEFLVVSVGCDLYLISFKTWKCFYKIGDAFTNEIQTMVAYNETDASSKQINLLACGSLDFTIKCWNASSWECMFTCTDHEEAVLCMLFWHNKENGTFRIVSGSDDCTIKVWNIGDSIHKVRNGLPAGGQTPELKEEKTLTKHSEFVSTLCLVTTKDTKPQSAITYMLSGSADFSILVWNQEFTCIRTLEDNKFPNHIGVMGTGLFATLQWGNEEHEDVEYLQGWNVSHPDPMKWCLIPRANTKILKSNCFFAGTVPSDAKEKPFLACATEDESFVQVWTSPYSYTPGQEMNVRITSADVPEDVKPQIKKADILQMAEASVAAKKGKVENEKVENKRKFDGNIENVSQKKTKTNVDSSSPQAKSNGKFPGDQLAKNFVKNVLQLDGLSPDMKRLLGVCLSLHEN
uniref:Uncharacterized protein n=1 Tax=Aplanochytrium stocchinoi TaxID=215587 RepID=A0A7S3LSI0_9STRA